MTKQIKVNIQAEGTPTQVLETLKKLMAAVEPLVQLNGVGCLEDDFGKATITLKEQEEDKLSHS